MPLSGFIHAKLANIHQSCNPDHQHIITDYSQVLLRGTKFLEALNILFAGIHSIAHYCRQFGLGFYLYGIQNNA